MQPAMMLGDRRYDSMLLLHLLPCPPGGMADKARVFDHLKAHLAEECAVLRPDPHATRQRGVLYGARP
ncbi:hypothetical protein DWU98_11620 [Dyella monticola]|uniref:Uncharacterized protein n=1 Tax=Dyella monticola TaxID=1927958 RepID=A0A370WYS9_9GAMM|nr:hypothetical protein [Dyella monticola]RDS81180.1 hypothetical protein DWU98_11620 [Dyella monticola]